MVKLLERDSVKLSISKFSKRKLLLVHDQQILTAVQQ